MGLGDIGNAFLIVLIFCLIQLFITLSIGLVQLRNNWDKYKCNPAVTPFAGLIGYDPVITFQECTRETQGDFMKSFLTLESIIFPIDGFPSDKIILLIDSQRFFIPVNSNTRKII